MFSSSDPKCNGYHKGLHIQWFTYFLSEKSLDSVGFDMCDATSAETPDKTAPDQRQKN